MANSAQLVENCVNVVSGCPVQSTKSVENSNSCGLGSKPTFLLHRKRGAILLASPQMRRKRSGVRGLWMNTNVAQSLCATTPVGYHKLTDRNLTRTVVGDSNDYAPRARRSVGICTNLSLERDQQPCAKPQLLVNLPPKRDDAHEECCDADVQRRGHLLFRSFVPQRRVADCTEHTSRSSCLAALPRQAARAMRRTPTQTRDTDA